MGLYEQLKASEKPSADISHFLDSLTIKENIPLHAALELTPVCNFRCEFCYARVSPEELKRKNISVMGFDEWARYIDEFADMGSVFLQITGGECTLHPDFVKIYRYAYEKGFSINVFTNGSSITDEILDTFKEMPPARVFLTLYGNSPETYKRVTGGAAFYEKVKANVEKLRAAKIDLVLQFTISLDNYMDTEALYEYAASLGCEFRYTNNLAPSGNCTDEVYDQKKVKNDLLTDVSNRIWRKKRGIPQDAVIEKKHVVPVAPDPNKQGIKCNAGKNSCFIRHDGMMLSCNMFDAKAVDTHGRSLKDCYEELNKWASGVTRILECEGCIHAIHCTTCIAAHYSDTKVLGIPSPKLCFKALYPEKAKEEREFFEKHGYLEV